MAEKKVHKKEKPNKKEATPQEKKIKDLRSTGCSLREIAEKLKIARKEVERVLAIKPKAEAKPKTEAKKDSKKGK